MDFNPFGASTDSLLYSWDELTDGSLISEEDLTSNVYRSSRLELRLVETDIGVSSHQYSMYSQPIDFMNLNQMSASDIESIVTLIEKVSFLEKIMTTSDDLKRFKALYWKFLYKKLRMVPRFCPLKD
jgi:hypothetical protein